MSRRHFYQPVRTSHHQWVGLTIFMETHRRVHSGNFGALPKPLTEWAWAEGGYCIDAPQSIPAGGCYFEPVPPPHDDEWPPGIPAQLEVDRG